MKLRNWTLTGLLAASAALGACGKAQTQGETTAAAPVTSIAANAAPASHLRDLGVAMYPGMETLVDAHRTPLDKHGDMIESDFKSADKPEKIASFYRDQLNRTFGDKIQFQEAALGDGMIRVQATDAERRNIEVLIRPDGAGSIVGVRSIARTN